ncbi:MAG: UDP-N-acetylmuramoyl-L-alanyl-D-glutamate--2,6-diaminopimelate ligase [bacterium]|nr:UDP-N-acetylmuramoyl-L-alanyl-D-glutamate--2,6-diaminopimelate ligase [bacterium]
MLLAEVARLLGNAPICGDPEVSVSGISCDSRQVKPGDIFVCVTGFNIDGHRFAAEAASKGAAALVVERVPEGVNIPYVRVPSSRRALALLSAAILGNPANYLTLVGITGTNGKTTTAYLVEAVLKAAEKNPGLLGTIEAHIGGETRKLSNTTPESLDLHKMFAEMRDAGQDAAVMEVSSHALALDRTYGIPFDIAVFTNLTQDHLDFHGDMENYFLAKSMLFTRLGTQADRPCGPFAVINIDDPYGERLHKLVHNRVPVITYGRNEKADVRAYNVEADPCGISFNMECRTFRSEVHLNLSGVFNLYNALAAIAVGCALRLPLKKCVEAVESVNSVPGRFQLVREGQDFTVIVDYAHTPDGLENLLKSARVITEGKLSVVFGCGGDRDMGKRAIMGRIASELADKVFITTDNPRSEDPETIANQIIEGTVSGKAKIEVVPDRAQAIRLAISEAVRGDCVVIAGKGHENYQKFRDKTISFDDREQARKALKGRNCSGSRAMSRFKVKVPTAKTCDYSVYNPNDFQVSLQISK